MLTVVASRWWNYGVLISSFCYFSYFSIINIPGQHTSADMLMGAMIFFFTDTTGLLPVHAPWSSFNKTQLNKLLDFFMEFVKLGVEGSPKVITELLLCSQMWSELTRLHLDKHSIPAEDGITPTLFCTSLYAQLNSMPIWLYPEDWPGEWSV